MIKCADVKELDDLSLIDLSKKGDQTAFTEIVRRNKTKIASTVYGMIGRCDEAEDIGQEVFIRFFNSIDNFRGDSLLSTYLTRIAINLSLNELKKRNLKRYFSLNDLFEKGSDIRDSSTPQRSNEQKEIVQMAIQKLSSKYKPVLVLRLLDGYSTEETAEILKLPIGTVLSRLTRAQKKLKEFLTPYLSEL